jgi:hypothetical protein
MQSCRRIVGGGWWMGWRGCRWVIKIEEMVELEWVL